MNIIATPDQISTRDRQQAAIEIQRQHLLTHILHQSIKTSKSEDLRVPTRGTPTQGTCSRLVSYNARKITQST
jgi:hypothetical protein